MAYYYDSRSALHEHVAMPLIRFLTDAETGHKLSVRLLAGPSWVRPRDRGVDGDELQTEVSPWEADDTGWELLADDAYSCSV